VFHVCVFILAFGCSCVFGQTPEKITLILKDGPLEVDEVTEEADGYWYKRGNMSKFLDRERVVRIERPKPPAEEKAAAEDVVEGAGKWKLSDAGKVEEFFVGKFKSRCR
jgi:hypothetical protein